MKQSDLQQAGEVNQEVDSRDRMTHVRMSRLWYSVLYLLVGISGSAFIRMTSGLDLFDASDIPYGYSSSTSDFDFNRKHLAVRTNVEACFLSWRLMRREDCLADRRPAFSVVAEVCSSLWTDDVGDVPWLLPHVKIFLSPAPSMSAAEATSPTLSLASVDVCHKTHWHYRRPKFNVYFGRMYAYTRTANHVFSTDSIGLRLM